jgi:spermidine synthase
MRLPFLKDIQWSSKNGIIVVTNSGEVYAMGSRQTSKRYPAMWADALAHDHARSIHTRTKILMLGLAGGGALQAVHARYPRTSVTAIEYDPVMVSIAHTLLEHASFPFPITIVEDAAVALPRLQETFDLVLVDLFAGYTPAPLIQESRFWVEVKRVLNRGGAVLLNVAGDAQAMDAAKQHFPTCEVWHYRMNLFCLLS